LPVLDLAEARLQNIAKISEQNSLPKPHRHKPQKQSNSRSVVYRDFRAKVCYLGEM
jgi:hypothetical protein